MFFDWLSPSFIYWMHFVMQLYYFIAQLEMIICPDLFIQLNRSIRDAIFIIKYVLIDEPMTRESSHQMKVSLKYYWKCLDRYTFYTSPTKCVLYRRTYLMTNILIYCTWYANRRFYCIISDLHRFISQETYIDHTRERHFSNVLFIIYVPIIINSYLVSSSSCMRTFLAIDKSKHCHWYKRQRKDLNHNYMHLSPLFICCVLDGDWSNLID